MSFPIDFSVAMWTLGFGAIGAAVTGMILANTDLFLPKAEMASTEFLEEIDLKTLGQGEQRTFKAKDLWKTKGAVIMAEASELSSLKPQLDQVGVPLYAVVKENIGTERKFYGPQRRTMLLLALFRWNVWRNFWRAWRSGYTGNIDGEGVILGGVFVIGPGKQVEERRTARISRGVLLEHREKEFGDKVSLEAVLDAVKKIKVQPSDGGE
ncbi:hypothetical protein L345_10227 [Ophiophagus hannah]|uniref:Peroxiredoxin-like 2A n=1 Tax=Ophiophagus hannah TaxID=8665 RepID=V8NQS9_OPHHA|nr:hypothetical protein L345_10227 [Ophiophagus hannah]